MKWNSVVDEVLGDATNGVTGVRLKSTVGGPPETLAYGAESDFTLLYCWVSAKG